jgi:hypothetical protein
VAQCRFITLLVWPRGYSQAGSREPFLQRLASAGNRLDAVYLDKELDGRMSEELWCRKSGEWQAEEQPIQVAIRLDSSAYISFHRILQFQRALQHGFPAIWMGGLVVSYNQGRQTIIFPTGCSGNSQHKQRSLRESSQQHTRLRTE